MIGDDWPDRAREAAAILMPKEVESIGPMLLEDIKAAFNDRDRMSSSDICAALNGLEGRPWGDWKGKSLTPNQLARLLKPFGIRSDNVRILRPPWELRDGDIFPCMTASTSLARAAARECSLCEQGPAAIEVTCRHSNASRAALWL